MNVTTFMQPIHTLLRSSVGKGLVVHDIINEIHARGGAAFLVGGAVRDLVLSRSIHDVDIEVHRLAAEQLESILKNYGCVNTQGKSFGVLRLDSCAIDWSLPRIDSTGRKPVVEIHSEIDFAEAARRRDLTMNAMGINLHTYAFVDPYCGLVDIEKKILRAPDVMLFIQDPLRFFRVMHFVGRFAMTPDQGLNHVCATMDLSAISKERVEEEFKKLLLRSKRPSLGIRWLQQVGRLQEILPQLHATIGVEQRPDYHPEGDVFEHSMQALDAAAALVYSSAGQKLIQLFAALCHDLGKVVSASKNIDGVIRSHGHAQAGVPLAQKMLQRILVTKSFLPIISKLIWYHMHPVMFANSQASHPAYKKLAYALAPDATLAMLAQLHLADLQGRNAKGNVPLTCDMPQVDDFIQRARDAGVLEGAEPPVLTGKDFLDVVAPGPELGKLVELAYKLQIDRGIQDKEVLKKKVLKGQ